MGQNLDPAGGPLQPAALVALIAVPSALLPRRLLHFNAIPPQAQPPAVPPFANPHHVDGRTQCQYAYVLC